MYNKSNKILKIDKKLPQIIIPANKINMFVDWWNTDIRFETSIPHSFNEGYVMLDNVQSKFKDINEYSQIIKSMAKTLKTTYRVIENQVKDFISSIQIITLYFKFLSENSMFVETYDNNGRLISNMNFAVGKNSEPEKPIILDKKGVDAVDMDSIMYEMNYMHLGILISCLWYIATTTKSTKYIYDKKTPVVTGRSKGVVQVSDTKYIKTPIYDMNKIRVVKVENLASRKRGWTYSHSFEVHGHYRHYQNGKTIFIKPFIKGKDKDFKSQKIIIDPEN